MKQMVFFKDPFLVLVPTLCWYLTVGQTMGILLEDNCIVSAPCTCTQHSVNCSGRGLVTMPKFNAINNNARVSSFDMDRNNLTSIKDDAFSNIPCFNKSNFYLGFHYNLISELSDSCFRGIESCVFQITLSNNRLTSLPHALRSLTRLRHLVLDGNPLRSLDSYTMSELGRNLWTLDISLYLFTSWPTELHFLRQLQMLTLRSIPFTSLPHNAFQGVEDTIAFLLIYSSNLIELPTAICDLKKLNRLQFDDNHNILRNTLYVDSCFNHIQLNVISFQNNGLVQFPELSNLPGNGTLYPNVDLSYNNIRIIQDTIIHRYMIKNLYLDHNRLIRIPYALNNIEDLEYLYMRNNIIASIEETDLEKMTSLRGLRLDFNQILFISKRAFVNNIHLRYLYLSNNNLKTIPQAFLILKGIFWIDLDQNEIDCSCSDFDFGTWNTSQIMRIDGTCKYGSETLKSFVTSNPPTCN